MVIIQTDRLEFMPFEAADAIFLLGLMNHPDYHRFVGDRGLRTVADAQDYIVDKMIPSYAKSGFGFWIMKARDTGEPIGFGGMAQRVSLENPDVGYAIQDSFKGRGYAQEATRGILSWAHETLQVQRVHAITNPDNMASINVLLKCGFEFEDLVKVFEDEDALNLYHFDF